MFPPNFLNILTLFEFFGFQKELPLVIKAYETEIFKQNQRYILVGFEISGIIYLTPQISYDSL